MKVLKAFLLALVLISTVFSAVVLLVNTPRISDFVAKPEPVKGGDLGPSDMTSLDVLSKLSLYPSRKQFRPLVAIVVENHEDARRHQRGLKDALLVQEYLVEGFISRFVTFFDSRQLPRSIGPVRSLRSYFLDGMQPWSSVVLHAGGSPNALDRVEQDEAIASVNGLFLPEHFLRMTDIPEPHNLFVSHSKVRDLLPNVVDKTEWPPYQVASAGQKLKEPAISEIFVNFFSPLHDVTFTYEPWFRRFTRSNGGVISEAHPRNVLVLEAPIDGIKEYGRLDIALSGEGKLLLFHSGTITNGLWQKSGTHEPFVFTDAYGNPLQFSAGQTWMIVLPSLDRVSWE